MSEGPPRVSGKIVGYRSWLLKGGVLKSLVAAEWWKPGVTRAACRRTCAPFDTGSPYSHEEPAPAWNCTCGLYAYLAPFSYSALAAPLGHVWVSGAIAAWGKVEVHPDGFRAEYAEPVALVLSESWTVETAETVAAFASEMDIPLVKSKHLRVEALRHGHEVPEDLVPDVLAPGSFVPVGGGYFVSPAWTTPWLSVSPITMAVGTRALWTPDASSDEEQKPKRSKGPKMTLRTPGPPSYGKYQQGDVVLDSRKRYWRCVRSGKPGLWEEVE